MPDAPSLAHRIQRRLERLYAIEDQPPVEHFARAASAEEREEMLVREGSDGVELQVSLPPEAFSSATLALSLDVTCQIVEGVSHFVFLAERIRAELPTTQLELELQAEVDKFVILGWSALSTRDHRQTARLHARLYENVRFLHDEGSERGDRYRLANALAARFCARLGLRKSLSASLSTLRAFYRSGQTDKIWLATAA